MTDTQDLIPVFREWLQGATADEIRELSKAAATPREYFYQIITGYRRPSSEKAAAIEEGMKAIALRRKKLGTIPLPLIQRGDLSPVCSGCPFYNTRITKK